MLISAVGVAIGTFAGILSGQPLPGFFFGILSAVFATYFRLQSKK